jgi:hypothetical protein
MSEFDPTPNDLTLTGEATGLPLLTVGYAVALEYAVTAHAHHRRKGTEARRPGGPGAADGVPYVAHLLEASALVLDAGGDEEAAIAALLHDVVEDQGGLARAADVRDVFGDLVADIVLECSDSVDPDDKLADHWFDRKRAHVRHIEDVDFRTLLVLAADKISNARATVADVQSQAHVEGGAGVFTHFRPFADAVGEGKGRRTPPRASDPFFQLVGGTVPAPRERAVAYSAACTLWYYKSVLAALERRAELSRYAPLVRITQVLAFAVIELTAVVRSLGVKVKQVDRQVRRDAADGWTDPAPAT